MWSLNFMASPNIDTKQMQNVKLIWLQLSMNKSGLQQWQWQWQWQFPLQLQLHQLRCMAPQGMAQCRGSSKSHPRLMPDSFETHLNALSVAPFSSTYSKRERGGEREREIQRGNCNKLNATFMNENFARFKLPALCRGAWRTGAAAATAAPDN